MGCIACKEYAVLVVEMICPSLVDLEARQASCLFDRELAWCDTIGSQFLKLLDCKIF